MSTCPIPGSQPRISEFQNEVMRNVSTGADPAAIPDGLIFRSAMMQKFGRGMPGIPSSNDIWENRLRGNTTWGPISHGELLEKVIENNRKAMQITDLGMITKADVEMAAPQVRAIIKKDAEIAEPAKFFRVLDKTARLASETALLGNLQAGRQLVSNVGVGNVTQQMMGGHMQQVIMQAVWGADTIQKKIYQRLTNAWKTRVLRQEGLSYRDASYGGARWGAQWGLIDQEAIKKQGLAATLVPAGEVATKRGMNTQWGKLLATPYEWMRIGTAALVDHPEDLKLWQAMVSKLETGTLYLGPAEAETIRNIVQSFEHSSHSAAFFSHARVLMHKRIAGHESAIREQFIKELTDAVPNDPDFVTWATNLHDETMNWLKHSTGRKGSYSPSELYVALDSIIQRDAAAKIINVDQQRAAMQGTRNLLETHKNFLHEISTDAMKEKERTLFNYEERVIDVWGSRVFPFFRFYSRYLPFMYMTATRHPGLTLHYLDLNESMQAEAQAKGWPAFMSTYLQLVGGPMGLQIALNPFHAAGLLDFAWAFNGGDRDDPDKSGLQSFVDQFILRNDLTPAPHWFLILPLQYSGLLGAQGRVVNPLDYTMSLKQVNLLMNLAIAKGVWPHDGPLAPFGQGIANWLAEYISGKSPVGENLHLNDPNQDIEGKIQQTMIQLYITSIGVGYKQWLYAEGEHQRSLDPSYKGQINQDMVDMYDQGTDILIEQYQNEDGEFYDAALDSVITTMAATKGSELISVPVLLANQAGLGPDIPDLPVAFFAGETMGSPVVQPGWRGQINYDKNAIPGPWSALQDEDSSFNQSLIEAGVDPDKFWDTVYYYQVALDQEWDTPNLSPEARNLIQYDTAYKSAGGKKRQDIYDTYYQIAYGNLEEPITLNGTTIQPEAIDAMGPEYQQATARIWLSEQPGGQEALDTITGAKEEIVNTSPEYAHYQAWSDDGRMWEDYGGLKMYRDLVCSGGDQGNQGQCEYYSDLHDLVVKQVGKEVAKGTIKPDQESAEIDKRMDQGTLSIKAYMAAYGIKFDKSSYNTDDIGNQPELPASALAESLDLTGNTTIPGDITEDRLAAAQLEFDVYSEKANAWLQENFGATLDTLAPIAVPVAMKGLAEAGIVPPGDGYMVEDYKLYQEFAAANNLDPSPKAYIEFLTTTGAKPGTWANQRQFHPMPGGWGFNTGIDYGQTQYEAPHERYGLSGPASMGQSSGTGYISAGGIGGMGQKIAYGAEADPFGLGITGGSRLPPPDRIGMGQRISGLAARMSSR